MIGWTSAVILLLTVGRQVYVQWRERSSAGVSKWLFIGQMAASIGFIAYSVLLSNWVFATTNGLMLVTAAIGQWLYFHNLRRKSRPARAAPSTPRVKHTK